MSILVIGDPHFMKHNSLETTQLHEEVQKLYQKHSINYTVVLGDVLDTFKHIDMLAFNRAINFLEMCQENSDHLFILVGNHDRINQIDFLSTISSMRAFKKWNNTTVVDTPQDFITFNNVKILLVPYVYPGRFFEALGEKSIYNYDLVFSHQEYYGIKLDSGPFSEEGDKYPLNAPKCFNGHIHTFSEVSNNLINVGTPYCKDFGDLSEKAVILIDITNASFPYQRIFLNVRRKQKITVREEDLSRVVIDENSLVKITVEGNPDTIVSNPLYKALIKKDNVIPDIHDNRASQIKEISFEMKKSSFRERFWEGLSEPKNKKLRKFARKIEKNHTDTE